MILGKLTTAINRLKFCSLLRRSEERRGVDCCNLRKEKRLAGVKGTAFEILIFFLLQNVMVTKGGCSQSALVQRLVSNNEGIRPHPSSVEYYLLWHKCVTLVYIYIWNWSVVNLCVPWVSQTDVACSLVRCVYWIWLQVDVISMQICLMKIKS